MLSVRVNVGMEKKEIINFLKKRCFESSGIIYGGAVRDEIISTHWIKEFNRFYNTLEAAPDRKYGQQFWDESIHPESKARMLVPKDVDTFFRSQKDAMNFIANVEKEFGKNTFYVPSDNSVDESMFYSGSFLNNSLNLKRCCINYAAGKTRLFPGHLIQIGLDIIYPSDASIITDFEPPFSNGDLSCNCFVQDSIKGEPRMSHNPGEWYKTMSLLQKTIFTAKTINDMINFNTLIVKDGSCSYDKDKDAKRILTKITDEKFPWKILNLPYDIIEYTPDEESEEISELKKESCCICQICLANDQPETLAIIRSENSAKKKIAGAKLHHSCLITHLNFQLNYRFSHPRTRNSQDVLMCPFKCPIDFGKCLSLIDWEKMTSL